MPKPTLKWTKPDADEPYYVSACGRFELWPLYLGRCRPQGYEVNDRTTKARRRVYDSLKGAKDIAQQWMNTPL